jgi:uncharacterized protein (DUF488 family)
MIRNLKAVPPMKPEMLFTIGVYGFSETAFFETMVEAGIDTFCDIRARRGLRGSTYSFANSKKLQARLGELGIRYLHFKDLAPSAAVRERQKLADQASGTQKRDRSVLGDEFIRGYQEECLCDLQARDLLIELGNSCKRVLFFCVEREPGACHRSLLANYLSESLQLPVKHLLP